MTPTAAEQLSKIYSAAETMADLEDAMNDHMNIVAALACMASSQMDEDMYHRVNRTLAHSLAAVLDGEVKKPIAMDEEKTSE